MRGAFAAFCFVVLPALAIWISVSVWNECRDQGNSFFYCLRLVSK